MTKRLVNLSDDNAKRNLNMYGEAPNPQYSQPQVLFFTGEPGAYREATREPMKPRGSMTYEDCLAWVEANESRAWDKLTAFAIVFWT